MQLIFILDIKQKEKKIIRIIEKKLFIVYRYILNKI